VTESGQPVPVAIALGSNLGDRAAHLAYAVERLSAVLDGVRVSNAHETAPVGVGDQPPFLNAAIAATTVLPARPLLDTLLAIERDRGRARPFAGAPRTLDLDLILHGDAVVDEPGLQVPHPRFRARRFVLAPLAEVAPEMRDPLTGLTVRELLARVDGPVE
jgi:2-amino-4-hydroxy-6-hydroxymethyldihydropteridine diphosphokinase